MPEFCPQCGAELRLRTARAGRNAGNQFYGCSRWRRGGGGCSFTADKAEWERAQGFAGGEQPNTGRTAHAEATVKRPELVAFKARPKFRNHRVRFFQTFALPREVLDSIQAEGEPLRKSYERCCSWRMDFPDRETTNPDPAAQQVLKAALKILTRGRLTGVSPALEAGIRAKLNHVRAPGEWQFPLSRFSCGPALRRSDIWLDGTGTEEKFYWEFLPSVLGAITRFAAVPQVQFSSLVRSPNLDTALLSQRVDFLISIEGHRIVVELDGPDHQGHEARDEGRKALLAAAGCDVFEIENNEVQNGTGPNLDRLRVLLSAVRPEHRDLNDYDHFVTAIRVAHQVQVTVIEALLCGLFPVTAGVRVVRASTGLERSHFEAVVTLALEDLRDLVANLARLYGVGFSLDGLKVFPEDPDNEATACTITFSDDAAASKYAIYIQDFAFEGQFALEERPTTVPKISSVSKQVLNYFLNYIFGHDQLREGQDDALERALIGQDSIVLLPTAHGKSIAFQLAAMLLPGVAIVVDPILALIDDQIDNLRRNGIDRAIGISSQIEDPTEREEITEAFGQGQYLFCYIAPERFQTVKFRNALKALTVATPVSLVAVDEAHCVSEWGHDFRTAYLNLGRTSREYCRGNDGRVPPLLALTGTASHAVLHDVQRELQIHDFEAIITPKTFDRAELHFGVHHSRSSEKWDVLRGLLRRSIPADFSLDANTFFTTSGPKTRSGVVFCPHVNGPFGVQDIATDLRRELSARVELYAGSEPKNWNEADRWERYKQSTAYSFKNNRFPLLVATKGFGMGIDKPNIRFTVHFGLPQSVESFYQEAGRAGRDGKMAKCVVLFSVDDKARTQKLLSPETTPSEIGAVLENRPWGSDDDVTRQMFFHHQAFRGVESEINTLRGLLDKIGDLPAVRTQRIVGERKDLEKGIHRLVILGVVRDYTINYGSSEFEVYLSGATKVEVIENYARYVEGYNRGRVVSEKAKVGRHIDQEHKQFVLSACKVLIDFIYDTVERGRRRALREMLSICEEALSGEADKVIRARLLRYLESRHAQAIQEIVEERGYFTKLKALVDGTSDGTHGEQLGGVRSQKDAQELRGQAARFLESYPDHPGLLVLRAVADVHCADFDIAAAPEDLKAAVRFSRERYDVAPAAVADLVSWALTKVSVRRGKHYRHIVVELLYDDGNESLASDLLETRQLTGRLALEPARYVFARLCDRIRSNGLIEEEK